MKSVNIFGFIVWFFIKRALESDITVYIDWQFNLHTYST